MLDHSNTTNSNSFMNSHEYEWLLLKNRTSYVTIFEFQNYLNLHIPQENKQLKLSMDTPLRSRSNTDTSLFTDAKSTFTDAKSTITGVSNITKKPDKND